jgi:hypothetical protein
MQSGRFFLISRARAHLMFALAFDEVDEHAADQVVFWTKSGEGI